MQLIVKQRIVKLAQVKWLFDPRALWIGLYWNSPPGSFDFYVYLCLLPMFPVRCHFVFTPLSYAAKYWRT